MAGLIETVSTGTTEKVPIQAPRENVAVGALAGVSDYIDGFSAVALTVAAALLVLRKKFHQDTTEIHKGQSEDKLIQTLIQQAEVYKEDARKAWEHRTRDAQQIARQEAEIQHMYETLEQMRRVLHEVAPDAASMLPHVPRPNGAVHERNDHEDGTETA